MVSGAGNYDAHRREAALEMRQSSDPSIRQYASLVEAGQISDLRTIADTLDMVVNRLRALEDIRKQQESRGSVSAAAKSADEHRSLKNAERHLSAMLAFKKSSHVTEHKIPGTEKTRVSPGIIRDANELQVVLEKEMRDAGATKNNAEAMAFVMSWAAFGKSIDEMIRDHPFVFIGMPHQKRLVAQWLDRAKRLRSGR